MSKLNKKTLIGAGAAAGITAALLFGGSAVSTAFTSSSSGHVHADTATIGATYQTGDLTLSNAIPNDKSNTATVSYTNNGSVPEELTLTLSPSGAALGNVAQYVNVVVPGVGTFKLSDASASYDLGKVQPNGSFSESGIYLQLADNTPSSDAGKTVNTDYTLTATATH